MIPLQRTSDNRPKYSRLADWVRQQIRTGELLPDQQLLSYTEIEAKLGFSQNTVDRAYGILEQEGLIYRQHGRGVFVKSHAPAKASTGFIGYIDREFQRSRNYLYYTHLLQGAQEAADQAGKQLVVIGSPESFTQWEHLEGVLFCAAGHDPSFSSQTLRAIVPEKLNAVNSVIPDPLVASVVADDADGIRQLVDHLFRLGHRRISYLSQIHTEPAGHHPLVRTRHQAYLSSLRAYGIKLQPGWTFTPEIAELPQPIDYIAFGREGMREWLRQGWLHSGCTALMAHNDYAALGAIEALEEYGLSVPQDVSVVGFDGVEGFQIGHTSLTTIEVPLHKIGAAATRSLLSQIEHPKRKPRDLILPVKLIQGHSTAAIQVRHAFSIAA